MIRLDAATVLLQWSVGGGNAERLKELPPGVRLGHNLTAFRGGFRLWSIDEVWTLTAVSGERCSRPSPPQG